MRDNVPHLKGLFFEEFSMKYVYYAEQYPQKKYNEMRWVEDKEKELKAKKMQQIQELRKRYVVASGAGN